MPSGGSDERRLKSRIKRRRQAVDYQVVSIVRRLATSYSPWQQQVKVGGLGETDEVKQSMVWGIAQDTESHVIKRSGDD
jgi:hypothetical protein